MWTHRVYYVFALVFALLYYVLSPLWFAWYFLMLTLLVFPFDIAISLPGMLTRKLLITAPDILEQGERADLTITVEAKNSFPSGIMKLPLQTGESDRAPKRLLKCEGARGSKVSVGIDTMHCGIVFIGLRRFWAASLFGLLTMPIPFRYSVRIPVLPLPVKPRRTILLPRAIVLRPKPGGGFSEDHDLRPYRDGDQMRSVHWKLSAKHDSLIVREALSAPPQSRLLHAEQWKNADERDLILGRLRWVSSYLLERDMPHYVKFGDNRRIEEISRPSELIVCLCNALGGTSQTALASTSARGRFTWVYNIDARWDRRSMG